MGRLLRHLRRRGDRDGHPDVPDTADTWSSSNGTSAAKTSVAPSNVGRAFDERVGEALRGQQPRGQDADYDLVRDHFDVAHYLLQAPGVLEDCNIDPVRHFLRQGPASRFTPEPNFSTDSYLKRHPHRRDGDVHPYAAWLREGREASEIGEPVMGTEKLAKVPGAFQTELEADDIVVVTTASGAEAAATPPGVRRVDFAKTAQCLGPLMRQQVLVELLRSLCVDAIVGIGSRLLLDALTPYGRALAASERIYLGFSGLRRGPLGQDVGTSARYFYRHVELVERVFVDAPATAVRLIEDYQLPDDIAAKVRSVSDDRVLAGVVHRLLGKTADGRV